MVALKPKVRVCLVDMNAGLKNEAMRCLRGHVDSFAAAVRETNPYVEVERVEVSPRDRGDIIVRDADLYLCSGGPGSPFDAEGTFWDADFRSFLDGVVRQDVGVAQRSVFAICYSFELAVRHFDIAKLVKREQKKFGVMPAYTTTAGRAHPMLAPFGDRIFAFEHRNWDALDVRESRLSSMGGASLARESREGVNDKGESMLAFHVGEAFESTLFHPEADRAGIRAWIDDPDHEAEFREVYGDLTHERMMRTVDNPERIDRTHRVVLPSWFRRRFAELARYRDFRPLLEPATELDDLEDDGEVS
jgi:homoserine O-succinyltransferase